MMSSWKDAKQSKPDQGKRVVLKIRFETSPVVGYWGCGRWEACTVNMMVEGGEGNIEASFESEDVTHYAEILELP